MLFGLDSFQTSHFILEALAEFFGVTIPNSTELLQGRLEAVTILTAALAQHLRGSGAGPQYDDIISRANVLEENNRQMLVKIIPILLRYQPLAMVHRRLELLMWMQPLRLRQNQRSQSGFPKVPKGKPKIPLKRIPMN